MKPPKFSVGQAVVCIDEAGLVLYGESLPKARSIYTVREVVSAFGEWGIRLSEIVNSPHVYLDGFREILFREGRFAPVELLPDEALAELKELLEPVAA